MHTSELEAMKGKDANREREEDLSGDMGSTFVEERFFKAA